MSFLEKIVTSNRSEELRSAFHCLNHDLLRQQGYKPPTPPLTPESTGLSSTNHMYTRNITSSESMFTPYTASQPRGSSSYDRARSYACPAVPHQAENKLSYTQNWVQKSRSCLTCPDRSPYTVQEFPPKSRELYRTLPVTTGERQFSRSNIEEPLPYLMKSKDAYKTDLPVVPKRRFCYSSDDYADDGAPVPKKLKITSDSKLDTHEKSNPVCDKVSEKIACQVNGILSLPGSREPKYEISSSELERRVSEPECLTKVDMIAYVRLAKNSARTLLENNDIRTNQHNKRSEHTVLSKMCEAECQVLAQGVREINFRYFPGTWFAKKSVQEITREIPSPRQQCEVLRDRIRKDETAKCVLLDMFLGLEHCANDDEMKNFNLMSHSFGMPNLKNNLVFFYRLLDEEVRMLKNMLTSRP